MLIVIGIYFGLLLLLQISESRAADSPLKAPTEITNLGSAVWYSIVTLTTVGYGDFVPRSFIGKVIGAFFAICSTFLVAFLIGIVLSLLRGRLLPIIRLFLSRKKRWYIFENHNSRADLLGKNLLEEHLGCVVIYAGSDTHGFFSLEASVKSVISTELGVEEILRYSLDKSKCTVFFLDDDSFDNYQRGSDLLEEGVTACCMTEYEPDHYPPSLILYDPYVSSARTYWNRYPANLSGETIVLIGSGKYAEAILEQALTVNVFGPGQQLKYLAYGDYGEFRRNHPYLSQICRTVSINAAGAQNGQFRKADSAPHTDEQLVVDFASANAAESEDGLFQKMDSASYANAASADMISAPSTNDLLFFMDTPWNEDWEALMSADRIILCSEDEGDNLEAFNKIHRYMPISAPIYARISQGFDQVIPFGAPEMLFTSENVLRKKLDRWGMMLNNIYLRSQNLDSPKWEELNAFLRRSNIASADHLFTKVRILLGGEADSFLTKEVYASAYEAWRTEWPEKKDLFRWIEHERWVRFYVMNNWQFNEVRDDAKRRHNMIRPFDCLSESEQAKDDYAWEMLGEIAKNI